MAPRFFFNPRVQKTHVGKRDYKNKESQLLRVGISGFSSQTPLLLRKDVREMASEVERKLHTQCQPGDGLISSPVTYGPATYGLCIYQVLNMLLL
jgi:hypothetical protein